MSENENENKISYERAVHKYISFFIGDEAEDIMTIDYDYSDNIRIPCIGEHVYLASYEHDRANDKKPLFWGYYKVINVCTLFNENKGYQHIAVNYQVILEKDVEEAK